MQPDLLEKMAIAQEQGDDELVATLMREFLRTCDLSSLPPELQEAYCAQFDEDPSDPALTARILGGVRAVLARDQGQVLTIGAAVAYALANPTRSQIAHVPPDVVDLVRDCSLPFERTSIAAEPLIALLKRGGIVLQIEQVDALSETLKRVYPHLASAAKMRKGPAFRAARVQRPGSDDQS